jgi:NAD(P) transhydrogenase subunit beta
MPLFADEEVSALAASQVANLAYLVAAALFIFGLKGLTHPRTAVRGNLMGATGMLVAVLVTLLAPPGGKPIVGLGVIAAGLAVGAIVGMLLAVKIQMTAMPQMVALLNGFGGAASALVAWAELIADRMLQVNALIAAAAAGLIGAVTFFGSLVAFGKLQELKLFKRNLTFPGQQLANGALLVVCLILAALMVGASGSVWAYLGLIVAAAVLGFLLVTPIGGADMPVVIALLNSYSGLAAAATGFVIDNNVLIIGGSLVGASGVILTKIMCRAMNRSLANVLFGGAMGTAGGPSADDVYGGKIKAASPEEIAMLFDSARRVVIVPGYGMAVAQAQHAVRDLADLLESRGITVEFAIHPVAGRMPGHMNVLLAEAEIPYEKLREMDEINPTFPETDVAIVIGANDVVNPVARTDPKSPIAGMPILEVDKARTVVVVKRSLSPGFAGIPNPLFAADNTLMYFADGKKAILDLVGAIKEAS